MAQPTKRTGMKIKKWKHENVQEDGTCLNNLGQPDGAVNTHQGIRVSPSNGGCGLEKCNCSNGHWLMISFGRDEINKTVSGITVYFENWGEMQLLLTLGAIN